jgi:hypothetical protein
VRITNEVPPGLLNINLEAVVDFDGVKVTSGHIGPNELIASRYNACCTEAKTQLWV